MSRMYNSPYILHEVKQRKCSQQICLAGPTLIAAVPTETSPETVLTLVFF